MQLFSKMICSPFGGSGRLLFEIVAFPRPGNCTDIFHKVPVISPNQLQNGHKIGDALRGDGLCV